MELESNKFKRRLIIIAIILIIGILLGELVNKTIKEEAQTVDKMVETIQSTTEEDYNKMVEKKKAEGNGKYVTKEEALSNMQAVQDMYDSIYKNSEGVAIITFALAMSGSIMFIMMYCIFTNWLIYKVVPDIKKWLAIIIQILILIIIIPVPLISYLAALIGVFGQLPFAAYTLYKYIKTKKAEDKDDIITEKNTF